MQPPSATRTSYWLISPQTNLGKQISPNVWGTLRAT
jgi:hypothetical protein